MKAKLSTIVLFSCVIDTDFDEKSTSLWKKEKFSLFFGSEKNFNVKNKISFSPRKKNQFSVVIIHAVFQQKRNDFYSAKINAEKNNQHSFVNMVDTSLFFIITKVT